MSLGQWLFLGGATFLAFFLKGITGFGNTVVMSPLYLKVVSPTVVTPVDLLFSIPTNAWIFLHHKNHVKVREMIPVVSLMFLGMLPGALLLKHINVQWFKLALGLLIIGIAIDRYHHKYMAHGRLNKSKYLRLFLSLFSGLTVGMFGIGLPIAAYLTRTSKDNKAFKGQLSLVFLCENLIRTVVYSIIGLFTLLTLKIAVVMIPSVLLGLYTGMKVCDRVQERYVDYLIVGLLCVIGFNLILQNISIIRHL